jgi:SAM-dependent methyltransferase
VERLEDTLRRLQEERDEADRRYNDALTALDRAGLPALDLPSPPAGFDDGRLPALNEAWRIAPEPPAAGGLKGRLKAAVWNLVGPYFQRQETFNSWLVDHLNRNLEAARRASHAQEEAAAALRAHAAAVDAFRAHLIRYLQEITLYVDSRDRETGGRALVLNAAISGVADTIDKRAEAMAVREQRLDARTDRLAAALDEVRASVAILQHASAAMKRALDERGTRPAGGATDAATGTGPVPAAPSDGQQPFAPSLDAYKYVAFEDRFRGSRDAIRERLASYLPFFTGQPLVLDVGCGRGEFLELLAGAGIPARGLDLNQAMVDECRGHGLDVAQGDAVGYLRTLGDASLGGIFAAQVVEHLQPAYLRAFLEEAARTLKPGGRIVLETLNPACWVAFFESFLRDITHVWPLHPETLQFLVLASGFSQADLEYRSPVPAQDRLATVAVPAGNAALSDVAETLNANAEKLNARLFTFLDYAVVGSR